MKFRTCFYKISARLVKKVLRSSEEKMKRILLNIIAVCGIAAVLTSCGDKPVYDENGSRTSSGKIDSDLVGMWSNGNSGYKFDENGKASLIMDFSSIMGFKDDGTFNANGQQLDKDKIVVDGDNIRIYNDFTDPETGVESEVDFLVMKSKGDIDTGTYNGSYEVLGGGLMEFVASRLNVDSNILTVEADFADDSAIVNVLDFLDYDAKDGELKMFNPNFSYVNEESDGLNYTYTIDGDNLTMIYADTGGKEEYSRVKEN